MSRGKVRTTGALISLVLWALIVLAGAGCRVPPGGNKPVDPNKPSLVEPVIDAGLTLAQALGLLWPPLLPIATAVGGVWAGYKRLKPRLQEAQKASDKYYAAGETLTSVLEDIKTNEPDVWAKLGPRIQAATSSRVVTAVENTIREFRGLDARPELTVAPSPS